MANEMTQEELANKCGISRFSIHNIEKGKFGPRLIHAQKIADALGVKIDDIDFPTKE